MPSGVDMVKLSPSVTPSGVVSDPGASPARTGRSSSSTNSSAPSASSPSIVTPSSAPSIVIVSVVVAGSPSPSVIV